MLRGSPEAQAQEDPDVLEIPKMGAQESPALSSETRAHMVPGLAPAATAETPFSPPMAAPGEEG